MANRDYGSEIDSIKGDLSTLRDDMQKLLKAVTDDQKQTGREAMERIQATSQQARDEINRLAREMGAKGREGMSSIENQIEERPFTSMLAAFGIGLLLGKLLDR